MKRTVYVKNVPIGGEHPVTVQSMTNTLTTDTEATKEQVAQLYLAGADIVRVSVPDFDSIKTIKALSKGDVPIIGDIHFDYKLALAAIENGVNKIRINPSNLTKKGILEVVRACKERNIPIRVGVNKGSVRNNDFSAKNLAALALDSAKLIEDAGYDNLVLAVKASDIKTTVEAYRILDKLCNYPLHIGLTEAGTKESGITKSSIAIGSLLLDGIGNTVRVSLTANPIEEVYAAKKILRAVGLEKDFVEIIACPTCARTCIEVERLADMLEQRVKDIKRPIKIAVMGCVVNGIGESKGARLGVAGGKHSSSIFLDGKIIKTVKNEFVVEEIMRLLEEVLQ